MPRTKAARPESSNDPPALRVEQLMTGSPRSCRVGDTANDAARIMWEQDCGAVPVLGEAGEIAGIVTDRDICMASYFQGVPLTAIPVAKIMSSDVCTCRASDDLAAAAKLMRNRQVNRLPVVSDGDQLVGMLSLCDMTQGVTRAGALRQKTNAGQVLLETVAAIKEPRVPPTAAS